MLVPSNAGEQSWSAETVEKPAVQEHSNCVRSENTVINEANILAKYPAAAKARKCGADGQFYYEEKYKHLNSLLKFGIYDILKIEYIRRTTNSQLEIFFVSYIKL